MGGLFDLDWRALLFTYASLGALVLIGRQFEKRWPAQPTQSRREVLKDYQLVVSAAILNWLARPLVIVCATALVNAAGGGLIRLKADTPWHFALSLVVFMIAGDFYAYWNHRISHAIPALWAMHSLHHSAESMTLITGARHLWLESVLNGAFLPVLALLFKVPPQVVMTALFLGFLPNGCAHLNVRLHLGRFSTWINGPQWHRIHHSVQPEHRNKNFAAILPLWDVMFGTAWIPAKDEHPKTGLVPGERPGILEGVVWPFRRLPAVAKAGRRLGAAFDRHFAAREITVHRP